MASRGQPRIPSKPFTFLYFVFYIPFMMRKYSFTEGGYVYMEKGDEVTFFNLQDGRIKEDTIVISDKDIYEQNNGQ